MNLQPATHRCDLCDRELPVTPLSPWEFSWQCDVCVTAGVISWRGDDPPPVWQPNTQGELAL